MNKHHEPTGPADGEQQQITLRGPAELVDALPYMLGFHPTDSIVLVALHGRQGRFGGRLRLGIPESPREWLPVSRQLAECLVEGSERRGSRPDGIVVFLCQDPAEGETGRAVMERLRPLAQWLRTSCGALDVPVPEALCVSGGRFWSYCCPDSRCCPAEGTATAISGTSVMAAAAAYAGIQVRGSLREMESRLEPLRTPSMADQERALDSAGAALLPRILHGGSRGQVGAETLRLARRLMKRLGERATLDMGPSSADTRDDRLISHAEAAAVILGLQDRETRDRAAAWMEGPQAHRALRLWRALARRCVGPYAEHAAAPLSLAGWVSWSTGDEPSARVALSLALRVDPEYVFARLLHQACNDGVDPEELRRCLRTHGTVPVPGAPAPVTSEGGSAGGSAGSESGAAGLTAGSAGCGPAAAQLTAGGEPASAGPSTQSAAARAAASHSTPAAASARGSAPGAEPSAPGQDTTVGRSARPGPAPDAALDAAAHDASRAPGPMHPPCHGTEGARRPGSRPRLSRPGSQVRPGGRKRGIAPGPAAPGAALPTRRRVSNAEGGAEAPSPARQGGPGTAEREPAGERDRPASPRVAPPGGAAPS
ncbi:DUF4192 family protein [Streptomyces sp. HNM0645]|nr:DUF4192 family protein [Streptomyces sp. HNM0645]MDI9887894.1 DUF4192 family protein [Streptomyces sp. HNM0645]